MLTASNDIWRWLQMHALEEQRSPDEIVLDGTNLSQVVVARAARRVGTVARVSAAAADRLRRSCELKRELVAAGEPIYGVTTGVGDSAHRQIAPDNAARMARNMTRFNMIGTGPASEAAVVRATMLIRANCLARGNSAINPAIVDRLLDLLRHDALPVIPARGSVGASGDLVPMSYVVGALIGEAELDYGGSVRPAAEVLDELGIPVTDLEAKDALAMINGTSFSAAHAVLAITEADELVAVTEAATVLAIEALVGNRGHYAPFIHENKPHPGQVAAARNIATALADSGLAVDHSQVLDLNARIEDREYQQLERRIQDRYSLRCAPHVIGVLRDTITWARQWIDVEINSSNDNPLFDVDGETVYSGGNFYGGHVAQAMDALKVAVANVASLLDRQVELLVDEKYSNGLTPNLISEEMAATEPGLHHGFKGMQVACSAVTAEALGACMPVSVFSLSTEAHNQDKVSMSPIAARSARSVIALTQEAAAIHLLAACQALDVRGAGEAGAVTRKLHEFVREVSPPVNADRRLDSDIAAVLDLIRTGRISTAAS
jgi:histidine ammonia-lyase/phenylalanine ammonia-lyase